MHFTNRSPRVRALEIPNWSRWFSASSGLRPLLLEAILQRFLCVQSALGDQINELSVEKLVRP
jgi:hypothetical protein